MPIDSGAASAFMTMNARLLDRLRWESILGEGDPTATRHALNAYRRSDGGYGRIEPDLRAPESQPVAAMHAFEVMIEITPLASEEARGLCDWLFTSATVDGGGIPFALPIADGAGCAPFWAEADPSTPSLHITAAVAGYAHLLARSDKGVAEHPWLARATAFCTERIAAMEKVGHALEFVYTMRFLDAAHEFEPAAGAQLERLGRFVPADGLLHVEGGLENEFVRPLDFAPVPHRPIRSLFSDAAIERELERLAALQQEDGGWPCDFASYSPAAALEWRGYLTLLAVTTLKENGRL